MSTEKAGEVQMLQKGQLWRMERQYLQVIEVGKNLIHYQMLKRPEQKAAAAKVANRQEVTTFLQRHNAVLVHKPAEPNPKPKEDM